MTIRKSVRQFYASEFAGFTFQQVHEFFQGLAREIKPPWRNAWIEEGDDSGTFEVFAERDKTPAEKAREAKAAIRAKERKAREAEVKARRERSELARLLKKYGHRQ